MLYIEKQYKSIGIKMTWRRSSLGNISNLICMQFLQFGINAANQIVPPLICRTQRFGPTLGVVHLHTQKAKHTGMLLTCA